MMTMLHSVWSGGGSAAGRRRSLLALGALLAMIATVLVMAAPSSQAQQPANLPPVAIAGLARPLAASGAAQTLDGTSSFDPYNAGGATATLHYQWEVITDSYADWLVITPGGTVLPGTQIFTGGDGDATFTVPNESAFARRGNEIEFRLTVWDGNPLTATGVLSSTDTVVFNYAAAERPTADIEVRAFLADPNTIAQYDDDGDGMVDEDDEIYTIDAIISRPGEGDNADNEWHIKEGAMLILDGSGSSDPDSRLTDESYDWTRVAIQDATNRDAATTVDDNAPAAAADTKMLTTVTGDTTPPIGAAASKTIGILADTTAPDAGTPQDEFYIYYRLTIDDNGNAADGNTGTADVLIVVEDQPKAPTATAPASRGVLTVEATTQATGDTDVKQGAGFNRWVVPPGATVKLTAAPTDGDGDTPTVAWEGAQALTVAQGGAADGTIAQMRVPATATRGQEFTVTVTATDVTKMTGSTTVTLVAAANQAPEAVAPADKTVNDGANGGDIGRFSVASGRVTLRGLGFDPDGDDLTYEWTEMTYPLAGFTGTIAGGDFAGGPFWDYSDDNDPATRPGPTTTGIVLTDGTDPVPAEAIKLPRTAVLTIEDADQATASFAVPEVNTRTQRLSDGSLVIPIQLKVTDSLGVSSTDMVVITISDDEVYAARANAGPDQQVSSGSFVRLNAAGSTGNNLTAYAWTYVGIATDPATEARPAISPAEMQQGFREGVWFPYDGVGTILVDADNDDPDNNGLQTDGTTAATPAVSTPVYTDQSLDVTTLQTSGVWTSAATAAAGTESAGATDIEIVGTTVVNRAKGDYSPTAGGRLQSVGNNRFPYFDAPALLGFNSVRLTFQLIVTDTTGGPDGDLTTEGDNVDNMSDPDTVTIVISDGYYSGIITGPDFCVSYSLGGPRTYPLDVDRDGVADICSLNTTRRATIARQNALEELAALNPDTFKTYLHGPADDPTTAQNEANPRAGTCFSAPSNLGDEPAKLAADACGPAGSFTREVSSPPAPADPATADVFFSGVITGPTFCTNLSLGGQPLYANDADGDGVADQCSLAYTRREAVARQNALEKFADHDQYPAALASACAALGTTSYEGDTPVKLAADECSVPPTSVPNRGTPLPTPDES